MLHVDKNDYYGGAEAALSLQEVEAWVDSVRIGKIGIVYIRPLTNSITASLPSASHPSPFQDATITRKPDPGSESRLGFSRAYSLSLSPQLIYTRSNLLPALISSKVYQQLEFLAVGSWWIYSRETGRSNGQDDNLSGTSSASPPGRLQRIPGGREDVFGDTSIDLRSTRALMRFLKLAADVGSHPAILEEWGSRSFPEFLTMHLKVPTLLQPPLLALTLSPDQPAVTTTSYALPRIHRHLTSIGLFGPGFGSVMPRWGGLAEVAQVACRALAVGGGVYVLNKGVESIKDTRQQLLDNETSSPDDTAHPLRVRLDDGEEIRTHWIVGNLCDLPSEHRSSPDHSSVQTAHTTSIVSSPLSSLFPLPSEGSPPPAGALVVYPTASLSADKRPPVYLMVHSSDTGECPAGQCESQPISLTILAACQVFAFMMIQQRILIYIVCNNH